MAADLLSAVDPSLASQCLAFCQALASQGKDFSFSLTINSTFSFSLDTKESNVKSTLVKTKKRSSPSTQRRNTRRRTEFLKRKLNFGSTSPSASDTSVDTSSDSRPVAAATAAAPCSAGVVSSPAPAAAPPPALLSSKPTSARPYFVKCSNDNRCDPGCYKNYSSESDLMVHMAVAHDGNLCLCQLGKPFENCKCAEPHNLWTHWSHCLPRGCKNCPFRAVL